MTTTMSSESIAWGAVAVHEMDLMGSGASDRSGRCVSPASDRPVAALYASPPSGLSAPRYDGNAGSFQRIEGKL